MEYSYGPSTEEVKAGGLLSSGQPGMHTQTFSEIEIRRKKGEREKGKKRRREKRIKERKNRET